MWFLLQVYKRSYDICIQLYEKELLTDSSYLYIYGYDFYLSICDMIFKHHELWYWFYQHLFQFGCFYICSSHSSFLKIFMQGAGCWSKCSAASSCFCKLPIQRSACLLIYFWNTFSCLLYFWNMRLSHLFWALLGKHMEITSNQCYLSNLFLMICIFLCISCILLLN